MSPSFLPVSAARAIERALSIGIFLTVVLASPHTFADCGVNPSVSVAPTAPDRFGDLTFQVTYSFPDTTQASQRRVTLAGTGPGFNVGFGSINPATPTGTWTLSYNTFCWATGQYPFTATATSCDSRTATSTANVSTPGPPQPSVSISYTGPDPEGKGTFTVSWSLPNTKPEQRAVYYSFLPEGSAGGAVLLPTPTESGSATFDYDVSCAAPGSRHYFRAWTSLCGIEATAVQELLIGDPKPTVTLTVNGADPDTGARTATIHWSFPGPTAPGSRAVHARWHHSNGKIWEPPATLLPLARTGSATFPISCSVGTDTHIVGVAVACERDVAETDPQAVPECENACGDAGSPGSSFRDRLQASIRGGPAGEVCCVGSPIRLTNGNMRMTDRDALGGDAFAPRQRTYDSRRRIPGWFGYGWVSILDVYVQQFGGQDGRNLVTLNLETGDRVLFALRNGRYVQVYPVAQLVPGTLTYNGTYTYRDGRVIRRFGSNSRLARLEPLSGAYSVDILYNGSNRPYAVVDSRGVWRWDVEYGSNNRVETITVSGGPGAGVWRYTQSGANEDLVQVTSPAGLWRTYTYGPQGMESARDGAGNLIESHTYDGRGRALTSYGGSDEVSNIEYGLPGRVPGEETIRVTRPTGRTTDYYSRYIAGSARLVEVAGSCNCGTDDAVIVFDNSGRIVRQQNAHGYIAIRNHDAEGRVIFEQSLLKPAGCDPETDPGRCKLDPDALRVAALDPSSASRSVTYAYGDANWPDRATSAVTESVTGSGRTLTTTSTYDAVTGEVLTATMTGWTGEPLAQQSRTSAVQLYNGTEPAAFAPGGNFTWTALPQPRAHLKSADGPRTDAADVTTYVYYPIDGAVPSILRGRLAATRNAAGHITRFENYDLFGNATRVLDPNGVVTTATYDAIGRLLTSTVEPVSGCDTAADPLCATALTTSRVYPSGTGPLRKEVRAGGGVTLYTYDDRGRVIATERGPSETDLRERLEITYDPATTHKASESFQARENGAWVEKKRDDFSYDSFGRLVKTTHADDTFVAYAYGTEGELTSVRDESHTAPNTFYTYDAASRLASVVQTLGAGTVTTRYAYDLAGNLSAVTDPNGNVTTYTYDDFGQMLRQVSPVTGTTTYRYDGGGNLLETADANGATTSRTYDALGRVTTAVSSANGRSEQITWSYDATTAGRFAIGRVASMTDPAGTTVYDYERRGLLRREARTFSGCLVTCADPFSSGTFSTLYRYDADGNRSSVTYPAPALTVTYTFDHAGRPLTASGTVTGAAYLPFGPLTRIDFANGTTQTMLYDDRYRIRENVLMAGANMYARYVYTHDAIGNIRQIADAMDSAYDRNFTYDDLNRLISADTGTALWQTGSYTWDAMGNPREQKLGEVTPAGDDGLLRGGPIIRGDALWRPLGRTVAFKYVEPTPRLETVTTNDLERPVSYDAAGNETSYVVRRSYSPRNLLEQVAEDMEPGESFQRKLSYAYDGRGVRVVGGAGGSGTYTFSFYTPELQFLATSQTAIIWFANRPVAQASATGTRLYTFTDHLATPIVQTDSTAAITWQAEYEPFGNIYLMRTGTRTDQPLRFPGQEVAMNWEGAEENYNVFRWYRAGWGRYTSPDPIGLRGGINLFAYAEGNPLRWADPTGLKVFKCCRDVQVNALVDGVMRLLRLKHCFLKTDSIEAGMGPADNGPLPACPVGVQTAIVPHTGQSQLPGTQCTEITNVNEQCVNDQLRPGTPTGRWTPVNQCNTTADDILRRCVNCPPPRTNVPDWRPQPSSSIW